MHLRGEIRKIEVSNGVKTVTITFSWLYEERQVHNWKLDAKLKWFPLERPFQNEMKELCLNIPFDSFRLHPDEDRVKMWGGGFGDISRFYKAFDHTNLEQEGGELIPYLKKHELAFKRVVVSLLMLRPLK